MNPRAHRLARLGAVLSGAGLALLMPTTWLQVSVQSPVALPATTLTGAQVAPATLAGALVVLAAGLAEPLARRWGRLLAAAAEVGGSALAAVGVWFVLAAPAAAAASLVAEPIRSASLGPGPVLAAALCVLGGVSGLLALRGRAPQNRRFEREGPSDWDRLELGEDPTR